MERFPSNIIIVFSSSVKIQFNLRRKVPHCTIHLFHQFAGGKKEKGAVYGEITNRHTERKNF